MIPPLLFLIENWRFEIYPKFPLFAPFLLYSQGRFFAYLLDIVIFRQRQESRWGRRTYEMDIFLSRFWMGTVTWGFWGAWD